MFKPKRKVTPPSLCSVTRHGVQSRMFVFHILVTGRVVRRADYIRDSTKFVPGTEHATFVAGQQQQQQQQQRRQQQQQQQQLVNPTCILPGKTQRKWTRGMWQDSCEAHFLLKQTKNLGAVGRITLKFKSHWTQDACYLRKHVESERVCSGHENLLFRLPRQVTRQNDQILAQPRKVACTCLPHYYCYLLLPLLLPMQQPLLRCNCLFCNHCDCCYCQCFGGRAKDTIFLEGLTTKLPLANLHQCPLSKFMLSYKIMLRACFHWNGS